MKNRPNSIQINKKILRLSLILVVLILFLSIIFLMSTLSSKDKSSLENSGSVFGNANSQTHRKFTIESEEESIYNIGEYQVNLNSDKYLLLDLSIKGTEDSFGILQRNNVLIQNAVIDTFATYDSIYLPNTVPGKERLKIKLKEKINDAFEKQLVEEVYFNKYLIR